MMHGVSRLCGIVCRSMDNDTYVGVGRGVCSVTNVQDYDMMIN